MTKGDYSEQDRILMSECLELARKAEGRTAPNPLVGAVITDANGAIVGRGFHKKAGEDHAEVAAFKDADDRCRGGTLYVNLEPCCHHGRTPPCVERVIASGVSRVVVGMIDSNPKVAGKGIESLKAAGIKVDLGLFVDECRWLNRGFIKRITKGLPWLILKMAATLDGRIADRDGNSRWITGPEARAYVHELRNKMDCLLIGGATAHKDDPLLNVRDVPEGRDPLKAIVDPQLLVRPDSRLCSPPNQTALTLSGTSTYIFTSAEKIQNSATEFAKHIKLVPGESIPYGMQLEAILKILATEGVQTVLCEGGGRLAAALLEAGLVDEVHWLIAPNFLVDGKSVASLNGTQSRSIADILKLDNIQYRQLGKDMLMIGTLPDKNQQAK